MIQRSKKVIWKYMSTKVDHLFSQKNRPLENDDGVKIKLSIDHLHPASPN